MSLTVNCNIIFCITQGVKKTPLPIKSQQNVLTDQTIVVISCNQPFIALKFLKRWCVSDLRMHCLGVKGNPANCMCCVLSHFSHIRLFLTLWTVTCQGPLSVGFSRQEHWSGVPFPLSGDLPNTRIKPTSLTASALQVDSLPLSHWGSPLPVCSISKCDTASETCGFLCFYGSLMHLVVALQ